jgi:hypothetical protein
MLFTNAQMPYGTETTEVSLTTLEGAGTLVIPEGAVIHLVRYIPAVAGDDGGFDVTIDGSGTDIVIGSVTEAQASQTASPVDVTGTWKVGAGQAGVLTATATGSPTAGSGSLMALFTRASQA